MESIDPDGQLELFERETGMLKLAPMNADNERRYITSLEISGF